MEWSNAVTKKWAGDAELQHATVDNITGMYVEMPTGDLLVQVTKVTPYAEQTYVLNCYNPATSAKGYLDAETIEQLKIVAQVMAALLIGTKLFINLTNFSVYDKATDTKGPGRVGVAPIYVMNKDVLLGKDCPKN